MKSKLFVFSAFDWLFTVGMIVGMFFLLATSFLDKNNQAILYMYQTKYEKAEQKWLQILSEKPFSPHYRMNLAFNYMSGNQLDKALREYEVSGNMLAVLSSVGGTVSDNVKFDIRKKIFFNSAVIFTQQQQVDRALNFYQRALEVDPDFNEAKVNIELLVRGRQILPPEQSQEQEKEEEEKGDEKKDEEKEDKKGEGEKEKEKGGEKEKEEKKQKNKTNKPDKTREINNKKNKKIKRENPRGKKNKKSRRSKKSNKIKKNRKNSKIKKKNQIKTNSKKKNKDNRREMEKNKKKKKKKKKSKNKVRKKKTTRRKVKRLLAERAPPALKSEVKNKRPDLSLMKNKPRQF